jgi:hypothetical protein
MLNLSNITLKFRTVAVASIVNLKAVFHAQFIGMLWYILLSNFTFIIPIIDWLLPNERKVNKIYKIDATAASLFHILEKYCRHRHKSSIFFQDLLPSLHLGLCMMLLLYSPPKSLRPPHLHYSFQESNNHGVGVTSTGIVSTQNFVKIYHMFQNWKFGGMNRQTQHCYLISLFFLWKGSGIQMRNWTL